MAEKVINTILVLALLIIFWPLVYLCIIFALLAVVSYFVGNILDNIWFKIKWWWTHR